MIKGKIRFTKFGSYKIGPWAIVDLDGVVVSAKHIHKNEDDFGVPLSNIAEMLNLINAEGYKILLYTTRKISQGATFWLRDQGLYFDQLLSVPVKTGKKANYSGLVYIDDNTFFFDENNITESLDRLRDFISANNKKLKERYGLLPKDILANRHRFKMSTQEHINGSILPIHITSQSLL
jgi:hypothetical protein